MGLSRWYKSWRHGHGFGVHSPFAYRMVREVLRPPHGYAFYAEKGIMHPELRLIYRILVDRRPSTVMIAAGSQKGLLSKLVETALPSVTLIDGGTPDMLIVHGMADVSPEAVNAAVIYLNDSGHPLLAKASASLVRGHIYRNPGRTLIIRDNRLPAQIFEIKF